MTSRIPFVLALVLVIGIPGSTGAQFRPRLIEIGVAELRNADATWEDFQKHINKELDTRGAGIKVRFVPGDMDDHLQALGDRAMDGAILAPFRYVVADINIDGIEVIARMRRGQTVELPPGDVPWDDRFDEPPPRDSYRSIIVMRRKAGKWPPKPGQRIPFAFSSTKSTSGFVYPAQLFREKKWLDSEAIVLATDVTDRDYDDLWRIGSTAKRGLGRTRELLESLRSGTVEFRLVGTNNSHFEAYLSEDERRRFAIVHESDPIPFDTFVVRRDAVVREADLQYLREALLSTQSLSRKDRQTLFTWLKEDDLETEDGRKLVRWRRYPDIVDWIAANNEDYDDVRRAAVKATGGTVVRMGISEHVHNSPETDNRLYFNPIKRELLKADRSVDRVFLDVEMFEKGRFAELQDYLRNGRLDLLELPVFHAMQMVGQKFPVFGVALFRNRNKNVGDEGYQFQIWTNRDTDSVDDIEEEHRFAYTTRESSSGFHWPFDYLKTERGINPEDLSRDHLVEGNDAAGVFQALIDGDADYGFIADFEYSRVKRLFPKEQLDALSQVEQGNVLNAVLLLSPRFCPSFDRYRLGSGVARRSWLARLVEGEADDLPDDHNVSAVKSLLQALAYRAGEEAKKFYGYRVAGKQHWDELSSSYERFYPSPAPLFVIAILALFISTGGILLYREKKLPAAVEAPLAVDDKKVRQVLASAITFARSLDDPDKRFGLVFGGKDKLAAIRGELNGRIVAVIGLFDLKTGKLRAEASGDEYFSKAGDLAKHLTESIKGPLAAFSVNGVPPEEQKSHRDWIQTTLDAADRIIQAIQLLRP